MHKLYVPTQNTFDCISSKRVSHKFKISLLFSKESYKSIKYDKVYIFYYSRVVIPVKSIVWKLGFVGHFWI